MRRTRESGEGGARKSRRDSFFVKLCVFCFELALGSSAAEGKYRKFVSYVWGLLLATACIPVVSKTAAFAMSKRQ